MIKIKAYKCIVTSMLFCPAFLTGCSGEKGPLEQDGERELLVENCFSRSSGADTDGSLVKDFGMVLLDDAGNTYTGVPGPVHVTYDGGWTFPEVTLTEATCRLLAFSPFQDIPGKELTVRLVSQTDYLASKELRLNWQNHRASIEMEHLLSLLEFTVEGSDACTLSMEGLPVEGAYDLTSGKLSMKEGDGSIASKGNMLLLFPGKTEERRIQIRYRDNVYDWYLPANTFEAGNRYTYVLSLSKEGMLILSGVSVRPWQAGGDYTGSIKPNE